MNDPYNYLSPRILQVLGIILLIASAIFWGATGRESVLLMSSAMSLIGLGAYAGAQVALRTPGEHPTPPPISAAGMEPPPLDGREH
jgi:hypothetical protein